MALGDVETVRELLVTEQKNNQQQDCLEWLQRAIECVEQLDLDGVANLLKQLRDAEKVAS